MADNERGLTFIISAIDQATKPLQDLAKTVEKTVKPVRRFGNDLKKAVNISGIPKLTSSIKGVTGALQGATGAATGLIGKLGLFGGGAFGAGMAVFKTQLLDVATGNQQLERELQRVTGTAQGAKDALGWLGQYALQVGRPVDELTSAFVALKREGLDPQGSAMRQAADIAGHTGRSIEEVVQAMIEAKKGQGKALADILGTTNYETIGKYEFFEFTGIDGQIERIAALKDKAEDMQLLIQRAMELKGMNGGAERMANTWDGLIGRLLAFKQRLAGLIMDSGVLDLLQEKLGGVVAWFDELEKTGELKVIAQEWAKALCTGIEEIITGAQALWTWIKGTFIPGFKTVKDFMGGWENMAIALGAVLAGPLVAALATLAGSVVSLGAAIMATPVGWVLAIIAGIAAGVYLIIKNWSKIKAFFSNLWSSVKGIFSSAWNGIKATIQSVWDGITGYFSGKFKAITTAFDQGVIQGIATLLSEFSPVTLIAEGINAISEFLFGVNLFDAGARLVNSIWDGIKSVWDSLKAWVYEAWEDLTGWLPDTVKEWMGIGTQNSPSASSGTASPASTGAAAAMASSHAPANYSYTGAAEVISKAGQAAHAGSLAGVGAEQTVRTEVIIKAENLPRGMSVEAPSRQADRTNIKLGYAMAGA